MCVCGGKSLAMEWQEYRCRRVDNEGIVDFCEKVYKRRTTYRNRILAYNVRRIKRICIKLNGCLWLCFYENMDLRKNPRVKIFYLVSYFLFMSRVLW